MVDFTERYSRLDEIDPDLFRDLLLGDGNAETAPEAAGIMARNEPVTTEQEEPEQGFLSGIISWMRGNTDNPEQLADAIVPQSVEVEPDLSDWESMATLKSIIVPPPPPVSRGPITPGSTNLALYGDRLGAGTITNSIPTAYTAAPAGMVAPSVQLGDAPAGTLMTRPDGTPRSTQELEQLALGALPNIQVDAEAAEAAEAGLMSPEGPTLTRSERIQTFLNDNGAEPKLAVDGVIGGKTMNALAEYQAQMRDIPAGQRLDVRDPRSPAYVEPLNLWGESKILREGSSNRSYVSDVQSILDIAVDGGFGPNTRTAIEEFQRDNGLEVTGAVDNEETFLALAAKATTDSTNPTFYGTPPPVSPVSLVEGSETPWSMSNAGLARDYLKVNGSFIELNGTERTYNVGDDTINIIDITDSTTQTAKVSALSPHTPTRIVFHNTAGGGGLPGYMNAINASTAQFFINREGQIFEVTPAEQQGNHTMGMQTGSVGIEIEGFPERHEQTTPENMSTPEQDAAAALLGEYLINRYPTINQALSHREIGLYDHDKDRSTPLRPSGKTDGWTALRDFRERVGQPGYEMGTGSNTNTFMGLAVRGVGNYFQSLAAAADKPEDDTTKQTNRDKQLLMGPQAGLGVPVETETPTGAGEIIEDTDALPSNIDFGFIGQQEGNENAMYLPMEGRRVVDRSGPTVGMGVDIGQKAPRELAGLPQELRDKLEPYTDMNGQAALDFVNRNPLTLTDEEVQTLNAWSKRGQTSSVTSLWAEDSDTPWSDLTEAQATVVASVMYQYGSNRNPVTGKVATPKFWAAATSGDWDTVIAELRNFGGPTPSRRNREADLLAAER